MLAPQLGKRLPHTRIADDRVAGHPSALVLEPVSLLTADLRSSW